MRHKGINKEETREKIFAAAGRCFRKYGYAGIGVNGLSEEAGVTSGAFYAHALSKENAFKVILESGLNEVLTAIPEFQNKFGADWLDEFVSYYLGQSHLNNIEKSCAMAALTSEVSRFGEEIQYLYESKMTQIVDKIVIGLAEDSKDDRVSRAWSMLSILIGGVNILRAMHDEKLAGEVAETIQKSAITSAGQAICKQ